MSYNIASYLLYHDITLCNYYTILYDTRSYDAILYDMTQYQLIDYHMIQYRMIQYHIIIYNDVLHYMREYHLDDKLYHMI